MSKMLLTFVMVLSFAVPALALPTPPSPATTPTPTSTSTSSVPVQWDGDWEGRRDWRRDRGWHRGWDNQRRHWRWRQARRDCFRYGDCDRLYSMQQRRNWYGRDWRRHRRGGFTLQFGF